MKKTKEPIPQHFKSMEEASDFWDTHDAGEYEEYLMPVNEDLEFPTDMSQVVLLEDSLLKKLKKVSRQRGVSLDDLVNQWLEERLLSEKLV